MNGAKVRFVARVLLASILNRKSRLLLVIAALTLVSMLVATLVSVQSGVGEQLGEGLKAFGANLTLSPPVAAIGSGTLSTGQLDRFIDPASTEQVLAATPGVESFQPRIDLSQNIGGVDTKLIGIPAQEMSAAKWRVEGALPKSGQVLVGRDLATQLKLVVGGTVEAAGYSWTVSGIVESGAEEDSALVATLDDALQITGGGVSRYLVRANADQIDGVAASLQQSLPGLEVRTLRQVAESEGRLLERVRILLMTVTLGVAISAAIAVGTTLNLVVLERGEEIGLLKAMGGTSGLVVSYFLLEQLSSALFAGLLGFVLGAIAAEVVSLTVFGSALPVSAAGFGAAVGVALLVVVAAGAAPVFRASRVESANALRGL